MGLLEMVGKVVSDKMQKTITVAVQKQHMVPKIRKLIFRTKKYLAHDAEELANIGDTVRIVETRPLSRHKRFTLVEVLRRAPVFPDLPTRLAAAADAAAGKGKGGSLLPPAAAAASAAGAAKAAA